MLKATNSSSCFSINCTSTSAQYYHTMDQLITIKEWVEFLKKSPSVSPRPDFAKVRAFCKHNIKALKQLECPKSQVHGWSGLIMDPALYILLGPNVFVIPISPGPAAIYPQFATPAQI
jgi:hypothetical protein